MASKTGNTRRGSKTPAKVGAIINTVATVLITPLFGIFAGRSPEGIPTYLQVIVTIINIGVLFEAVIGWIIYKRWMKTSATWPRKWLMVMGFIPFGFIAYLIAVKEWNKEYLYYYCGGREEEQAKYKALAAKRAAEEEERKRKEAAFRATPEGWKQKLKEDEIEYFCDRARWFCKDGSWDYNNQVPSPAHFDLRCRRVELDEKAGTVYIYFESEINLHISDDQREYRTRVEFDCKSFCKGRATKLASRVRDEILPEYQKGSARDYFSKFQKVESIIKFSVKK